jgi:hypothetical protein
LAATRGVLGTLEPAIEVTAQLSQVGMPIGPYDLQHSGIELTNCITFVTRNTKEFIRAPGLRGIQHCTQSEVCEKVNAQSSARLAKSESGGSEKRNRPMGQI